MHEQCFASRLVSPATPLHFREPISSSNTSRAENRSGATRTSNWRECLNTRQHYEENKSNKGTKKAATDERESKKEERKTGIMNARNKHKEEIQAEEEINK
jgi:hypothetical protein